MHIRYIFFGLWFFNITILSADAITVHNMTDVQIFCAIYYKNKTATRVTGVVGIPVQSKQTMERPSLKIGTDRELIFSDKPADLTDQLSAERLKTIPAVNIGTLKGTNFYIAKKDEELKGYNQAEWKVIRTIVEKFQEAGTKGVKVIVEGKEVIVRELEKAGSIIVQEYQQHP